MGEGGEELSDKATPMTFEEWWADYIPTPTYNYEKAIARDAWVFACLAGQAAMRERCAEFADRNVTRDGKVRTDIGEGIRSLEIE